VPIEVRPQQAMRCAIYTRKSTDEGLDQAFNSLDAQREACAAYILSQRHEGWSLVPEHYDDGGYSGGSMQRPALGQLMADVKAGRIDVIVVYKVDRLTRSLADFAKMVEILDAANASFVSVTQAFNTTTSMGRLTLNVLLSFAQFEREVTGERIRDKIAASKKKGMFMGGSVPFGYDVCDRKLVVNEAKAATLRHMMERYLELGSVDRLCEELDSRNIRTRVVARKDGRTTGGIRFGSGTLRYMFANRIYRGEIVHRGSWYPGDHDAIVPQALWDDVQTMIARNRNARKQGTRAAHPSLLSGLIVDAHGRPMTPSHANKHGQRYRYYITHPKAADLRVHPPIRMPAHDLEQRISAKLIELLSDQAGLAGIAGGRLDASTLQNLFQRAGAAADILRKANGATSRHVLHDWIERICIGADSMQISIMLTDTITHVIASDLAKVRRGYDVKLVVSNTSAPVNRDPALVALMADAHAMRAAVHAAPDQPLDAIAATANVGVARFKHLLRLSYLAPVIVEAILDGTQPPSVTAARLAKLTNLPMAWSDQMALFDIA
jgi:site-specific DNA recombinase